jgi:S1-C subfamily serine protease
VAIAVAVLACALTSASANFARRQSKRVEGRPNRDSSASPEVGESRTGILRAVSTVGLILVRNSFDPADQAARPRGSGVVVRRDGVIVTNLHVIARDNSPALYGELFFNLPDAGMAAQSAPRRYRITAVLIRKEYDLALLRITSYADGRPVSPSEALPAIEFGNSRTVQLLDKLVIIGFPEGGGSSVTVNEGVIEGKDIAGNWIKTSARLIHGNSGGAAVDREGRLIGIPTKVVIDKSLIGKNAEASRDSGSVYDAAAVGFLRPVQLVQSMLAKVQALGGANSAAPLAAPHIADLPKPADHQPAPQSAAPGAVTVRGVVRAADDHHPIAGARVGLVPLGVADVTETNLIAWGGTNADGQFELNKPAAPGRYTMKVRALGYQDFVGDVDVGQQPVVVELHASR